ncbi:MAG TPA: AEC family transporter [Tepidisphaeraceae bacterium]|jgi:hypothetical protein
MDQWLTMLAAMLPVFGCIGVGLAARRLKWLTEEADSTLITLTIRLLMPCLIIRELNTGNWVAQSSDLVYPPLAGFSLTLLGYGVCAAAVLFFGQFIGLRTPAQRRTFVLCAGMTNYGYIPIPLVKSLFTGSDSIDTLAALLLYNVGVEMAMWTAGMMILTNQLNRRWWVGVCNPVAISIVIALVLKLTGLWSHVPAPPQKLVNWLADCAIPMALLLTGATIADVYQKSIFRGGMGTLIGSNILRLALLPVMLLLILYFIPMSTPLHRVIAIQAAMPAAVFPIVLARHYGGDAATAVRVVLGTHALSLITLPVWLAIGL